MIRFFRALVAGLIVALVATPCGANEPPTPQQHLGYRPGADFHLAEWATVVDYFEKVDAASERVLVRSLGATTEGRPLIVATVSRPETIRQLGKYQELQRRLTDPGRGDEHREASDPVAESKAVVVITCSIHSTETASTFMAMELLHDLATRDDAATREVLDSTILLLVPSANPDGIDKVARWYDRSKGHPWEGNGMPTLYHKYAGHDTNRDWFMLNLEETRLLTRLLYQEWHPTILYDVHQMGSRGARLFVPPFHDPINPNIDPRIQQSILTIGAHMAGDLAASGKRGVLTNALYDNWWNGGNRTTPQRHNIVAVLTEAASVRMATPIFLEKERLEGGSRGFLDHAPAVNFVDPWPGGWWRLRDIVDYELLCARSLLTLAARYKSQFQSNLREMGRDAVEKGKHAPPTAWVVPRDQRDPGTAEEMVRILHMTGIEVRRARSPFQAGGVSFPEGTWILPAAQPYRAHLKDMMERQVYPPRFTARGEAEPPYDVAGWTLPLQMGVRAVPLAEPFAVDAQAVDAVERTPGTIVGPDTAESFRLDNRSNEDFRVLNALLAAGVRPEMVVPGLPGDTARRPPEFSQFGILRFPADDRARAVLAKTLSGCSTRVFGESKDVATHRRPGLTVSLHPQRLGVYQPWVPSMDEGWTRWVLERFGFRFATLHNAELRAGDLAGRIDALVIPSIPSKTLQAGYAANETDPAYVGGLGQEGVAALREFVESGGTLVCLENSCNYAIEALSLPVVNVLKSLKTSQFYAPGSIVRVETVGPHQPLALGVPDEAFAYFDHSLAFDLQGDLAGKPARVVLRYANGQPLESGWLLGPEFLQGKAALVEVDYGKGRVILFGFPPQHRGQTHGTFRLFFNAVLRGGMRRSAAP